MPYNDLEVSIDKAEPVELYKFVYDNLTYTYTSSQYTQSVTIDGESYVFSPEYIKRGDTLKLGNQDNSQESCTISVLRNNSIALLFQGSPPEQDSIKVSIYRTHGENNSDCVRILYGTVSQVSFKDSLADLTIIIESVLSRNIPRGTLSYFCQNCIYDSKCTLDETDYYEICTIDTMTGLTISCEKLAEKEDDYYTDGFIVMGNTYRQISKHKGSEITIKYPIPRYDQQSTFRIYPGCNGNFSVCARRFGNTDNFSGIPYIMPYNAFTHPTGHGVYWVDGNIHYFNTAGTIYQPGLGL